MPALELTGGLLSKFAIWGLGDLMLPQLLLGAAAAQDSVTQEGGLPPQERREARHPQLL